MHILKYFVYYAYFANYAYLCLLIKLALLLCRWPSQKYKYFCPPRAIKDTKRRAADDEGEEKLGALGHDYDILLHFAIAHMRRVDGALPGKQDGTKSLDLLAPAGEHK